jgi:hypothetical protein
MGKSLIGFVQKPYHIEDLIEKKTTWNNHRPL